MIESGTGGANTKTGLAFEKKVDLQQLLRSITGYSLKPAPNRTGYEVYFNGKLLAHGFKDRDLYHFLEQRGIEWEKILSKSLEPDHAIFVKDRNTLFIIEVKFQQVPGTVDEKLQTCDFKREQYTRLVHALNWRIEYVYVLNDWFMKKEYKDTLDYVCRVGCHYFFYAVPLKWLGLPDGENHV